MLDKKDIECFVEWDVFNWSRALEFWQKTSRLDLDKAVALEIGARNGGLSLWLSTFCNTVYCTDLVNPKQKVKKLHASYNASNILYAGLNALDLNEVDKYDLIVSKSVLGAMVGSDHNRVIDNIYRALKKGGEFWFAENMESTFLHRFARKHLTDWGRYWTYLNLNKLPPSLYKFAELNYTTLGFSAAFGRTNGQRNFLGKLDKYLFEKCTARSQHYIIAGVCRKS
jgi:SAM-dependent methyltransferase